MNKKLNPDFVNTLQNKLAGPLSEPAYNELSLILYKNIKSKLHQKLYFPMRSQLDSELDTKMKENLFKITTRYLNEQETKF